jgi:acyl-CoA synthetase (AMP-forming)/AMP-acid ligase II
MLEQTQPRILLASRSAQDRAEALAKHLTGLKVLYLNEEGASEPRWLTGAADTDPLLSTPPDDIVLALFTSGTTGTLKAAQHTQASYAAVCTNILANLVSPRMGDAMIHAASLIHASGTFVLPFWLRGGRSVVLKGFDPNSYLAEIKSRGATHTNLVPTMLQMLLSAGSEREVGRLRSVIYGASPMPRPVMEQALERWGPIFTQYYGQTEAPLALTVLAPEDHVKPDAPLSACGQVAVDVSLKLVDETGEQVRFGDIGEVAVAGPMVHAGYRGAPELNEQTQLKDGFIRTRDMGRFDERGFLHLIDRTSDMIVTGGYNVYPREVEDVLLDHPAIVECAVVSAPDPKWVETVCAFIVPVNGSSLTPQEIDSWVRQRLAPHKVPRRIEWAETLPKSAIGKVLRRELRDRLRSGNDA